MENPAAQKNISYFHPQYEYYLNFTRETDVKLRETSSLPDDFRMRAFQPQTINLILSLWIIGKFVFLYFKLVYDFLISFVCSCFERHCFFPRFLSLFQACTSRCNDVVLT